MLEPRRLAARHAAEYMSAQLGTRTGTTVGYRIRGAVKASRQTRIEIVTEGILTRMLVGDQDLPEVGLVIFDEFHERSIHADLGLALTLDLQRHLRTELRILVMSATLDVERTAAFLSDAAIVRTSGTVHPVDVRFAVSDDDAPVETRMARTIVHALRSHEGDVLAFLPGIREIRRTEERLPESGLPDGTRVHSLFGDAPYAQQQAALEPPADGSRRVILATSIAETSLTIEGIAVVVDSGLARTIRYDPRRGMTGLVTVPVSRAIAEQRRGRAGRLQPGTCYRLWTEARHSSLPEFPTPEIKATDLTHVALDLAAWGDPFADNLSFIDPPPRASIESARSLLSDLGALDTSGALTHHGRSLSSLPLHPRYGHMILRARELGHGSIACDIAALLEERDILSGQSDRDIDLTSRVLELRRPASSSSGRGTPRHRLQEQADRYRAMCEIPKKSIDPDATGLVLALSYPDRVGQRREATDRYLLSGGRTASLPKKSMLGKHEYLAVGHVDGAGQDVKILLAAPLTLNDAETVFEGRIVDVDEVRWDAATAAVVSRRVRKAGSLVLTEKRSTHDSPEILDAFLEGIRSLGLDVLPWDKESDSLVQRNEWIRSHVADRSEWPDCSKENLESTLKEWLGPFVGGMRKREHLKSLSMKTILESRFTREQLRDLQTLAPATIRVPSGSQIRLSYEKQEAPVLAVKLQELFGMTSTPTVARGKIPVLIHLLSPASRPLAVTQDLPSFWKNTYPEIRRQMQARYPKHPWPEDPMKAVPTRKTVRRRSR